MTKGRTRDGKSGAEPGACERPWVEVDLQRPAAPSRPAGGTPPARPCPGPGPAGRRPRGSSSPSWQTRSCLRTPAAAPAFACGPSLPRTHPLLMGTEAAVGKTCTLGVRGISEAQVKRTRETAASSSESSELHVCSRAEKRTDMQRSYHRPRYRMKYVKTRANRHSNWEFPVTIRCEVKDKLA